MCDICEWDELVEKIDWMLDDEEYSYANDTLHGIKEWVVDHRHATENQKIAVENIREGGERGAFLRESRF